MSRRQQCPTCGDEKVVLVQIEGYEACCVACLHGHAMYHLENVHDLDCGAECAEQLDAIGDVRRALMPGRRVTMIVRSRADGGGHDEVVARADDDLHLSDLLRAFGLTPAVIERRGATPLGRGYDGAEYELVRL